MPRANEFRIGWIQAHWQRKRDDRIQRQRIEFIVRLLAFRDVPERMRVIVDRFDFHNLCKQIAIDAGLCESAIRQTQECSDQCDPECNRKWFLNLRHTIKEHGRDLSPVLGASKRTGVKNLSDYTEDDVSDIVLSVQQCLTLR